MYVMPLQSNYIAKLVNHGFGKESGVKIKDLELLLCMLSTTSSLNKNTTCCASGDGKS